MALESLDALDWLRKHLEQDSPDLVRDMVKAFAEQLMSAEADAACGAGYGERSPERVNSRNGYRHRAWTPGRARSTWPCPSCGRAATTRAGCWNPAGGRNEPSPRWCASATSEGVSTRRVDDVVKAMGIEGISKSQVSSMAKELDTVVEAFRSRPLEAGPYTYVWLDALTQKVREGGRVVNVAVVVATGVNNEGRRESLGFDVITTEDGAGWTAFLRSLVARGLSGVALVVSDDHKGLKAAIAAVLPGATWQRCRVHFSRNLTDAGAKSVPGHGRHLGAHHLRAARPRQRLGPARPGRRPAHQPLRRRCRDAPGRSRRPPRLFHFPGRALVQYP